MNTRISFLLMLLALCSCSSVSSTSDESALTVNSVNAIQATQKTACSAPEHRQFDFWIGNWTVTTADGQYAGKNSIKPILNNCALYESWTGKSGYRGESINFYDAVKKQWHQTWIDYAGNALYGDGGLNKDGSMVLSGSGVDTKANAVINRIIWTPNNDGSVRQHWETSTDDGKTWTSVFDGMYTQVPE